MSSPELLEGLPLGGSAVDYFNGGVNPTPDFYVVHTPAAGFEPDGSLDSRATWLALTALEIFRTPFDPKGEYPSSFYDQAGKCVMNLAEPKNFGVENIAQGFRFLRLSLGERPYGGFEIDYSEGEERTDLGEYLPLIAQGKLIINHWDKMHDFRDHLMGGLLATDAVTGALKRAAALGANANLSVDDLEDLGNNIDFSISYVRRIWQDYGSYDSHIRALASNLNAAFEVVSKPLAKGEALEIAEAQHRSIQNMRLQSLQA